MGDAGDRTLHHSWRQPPLAELQAAGDSLGEQLVRASANAALQGTLSGKPCAVEDVYLYRFPWYYLEAPPVLLEELQAALNEAPGASLSLLGPELPKALAAGRADGRQLRLYGCLRNLDDATLRTLSTAEVGAPLPDGSVVLGRAYGAAVLPWKAQGPETPAVAALSGCLRWLLARGIAGVATPCAPGQVVALAWCAMVRPTVLRRAGSDYARFSQPAGVWRSALAALSGSLEALAAAEQARETWEQMLRLARQLRQSKQLEGCNGIEALDESGQSQVSREVLEYALAFAEESLQHRDDDHWRRERGKLNAGLKAAQGPGARRRPARAVREEERGGARLARELETGVLLVQRPDRRPIRIAPQKRKRLPLTGHDILLRLVESETWEPGKQMRVSDFATTRQQRAQFSKRLQRLRECFGKEADDFLSRPTERPEAPVYLKQRISLVPLAGIS